MAQPEEGSALREDALRIAHDLAKIFRSGRLSAAERNLLMERLRQTTPETKTKPASGPPGCPARKSEPWTEPTSVSI